MQYTSSGQKVDGNAMAGDRIVCSVAYTLHASYFLKSLSFMKIHIATDIKCIL
jgi:hypothetical protein